MPFEGLRVCPDNAGKDRPFAVSIRSQRSRNQPCGPLRMPSGRKPGSQPLALFRLQPPTETPENRRLSQNTERGSDLNCLTWRQIREDSMKSNPADRLSRTLERNAQEPGTCSCSFSMNRCPERDSNPQGLLHQILRMCNLAFLTFMGVSTDVREASINAAQSVFVGLPTRKGRKSRK